MFRFPLSRSPIVSLIALMAALACLSWSPTFAQDQDSPDDAPAPEPKEEAQPSKKTGETDSDSDAEADPEQASEDTGFEEIELFTRVLEIVRQNYVDDEKTSYESLIRSALEGMLADLDPHSQFMHRQVFEQLKQNTGSTYEGVGITISFKNEILSIVTVREDGPAARAGVLPGDQILKINNILTEKVGLSEAIALLKGKPGQTLKLTLRRPATKEILEVEMVREVIKQESVKDITLLTEKLTGPLKIGYVRILQFSEPTSREFADALDELEDQGMQALILDLRNNPGGLLDSAVEVAGEFVPPGTVVLTTEGRPGSGLIRPYRTPEKKRRMREYPMAILVNHSSASGSEVVAGALQDLKRAIIIGETTFGKGSVQSIMPMGDGTAIRLTTAKYYTPSRRTIHENGVQPNIVASLTPREEEQLMEWYNRDTLSKEDRKKLDSFKDRQLIRAVDAMKGAIVYSNMNGAPKEAAAPESPDADAEDKDEASTKEADEAPEKKE